MWELTGYLGLFLVSFGAATLLPLQSEAVLGSRANWESSPIIHRFQTVSARRCCIDRAEDTTGPNHRITK